MNDNKSVIEETLKEYFDIGSDDDYVKLMDVKRVLKNSNIKEKNLVSLIYIIEDLFENVKFIYDTGVNNDRKYKIFKNLKTKN